jgi:hypothetical protein
MCTILNVAVDSYHSFIHSFISRNTIKVNKICSSVLLASPINLVKVLTDTMLAMIPKSEGDVESYQRALQEPLRDFERKMGLYGLLTSTDKSKAYDHALFLSSASLSISEQYCNIR